jgi:hypothetical protein
VTLRPPRRSSPWARERGLPEDAGHLAQHADVQALLQDVLDTANSRHTRVDELALRAAQASQELRDPRPRAHAGNRRADASAEGQTQRRPRRLRPDPRRAVAEASVRSLPQHESVARPGRIRSVLSSAGALRLLSRVAQRSAREEVLMKTQAPDRNSAWPQAGVERRPFRRVVVARRVDSERPTRMWSLLLPQNFDIGDQSSHAPAPRPSSSRRPPRPPFGARALTRPDGGKMAYRWPTPRRSKRFRR